MKKLFALILFPMILLSGCGANTQGSTTNAKSSTTRVASTTVKNNDKATYSENFETNQYSAVGNVIYKFNTTKSIFEKYAQIDTKEMNLDFIVFGDYIFYKETTGEDKEGFSTGKVYKVKADGSGKEEVFGAYANNLKIYKDRLYFHSNADKKLVSVDLNGKNKIVYSGTDSNANNTIGDFTFADDYIYFTSPTFEVKRVDYKGEKAENVEIKVIANGNLNISDNKLIVLNAVDYFLIYDLKTDSLNTINYSLGQSLYSVIYDNNIYHIYQNKIQKNRTDGYLYETLDFNKENIYSISEANYHFVIDNKFYYSKDSNLFTIDLISGEIKEIGKY